MILLTGKNSGLDESELRGFVVFFVFALMFSVLLFKSKTIYEEFKALPNDKCWTIQHVG